MECFHLYNFWRNDNLKSYEVISQDFVVVVRIFQSMFARDFFLVKTQRAIIELCHLTIFFHVVIFQINLYFYYYFTSINTYFTFSGYEPVFA